MAYTEAIRTISLEADSSIGVFTGPPGYPGSTQPNNGKQYCFVKVVSSHKAGLSTNASNEQTVGILQNKPQHADEAATIAISGVSLIQLGATLAAGVAVKSNGSGNAVAATLGTDVVLGILTIGGASGSLGSVLLRVN